MKAFKAAAVFIICIAIVGAVTPYPAAAEATRVRVSARAPIEKGDVAGAQKAARAEALEKAIILVLGQVVPETTYQALEPLLAARILPMTERFISNYQIVSRDVSDLAYEVKLSVTVDTDLLRKNLAQIGVIKEPGSPLLAAVFVTFEEAPLGLDHVRSLGTVAQKAVSDALNSNNLIIIPPPDPDTGFRVLRPPQALDTLVSKGMASLADLAVGVLFKGNGEAAVTGNTMTIPMDLSIQVVDVGTGTLVDVATRDVEVNMATRGGALLTKDLGKWISETALRVSSTLNERYLKGQTERASVDLILEGPQDAFSVKQILNDLQFRLGETAAIIPMKFSLDRSRYVIWTSRSLNEILQALSRMEGKPVPFRTLVQEGQISLVLDIKMRSSGVLEFGEEVTYYRHLPVPGIDNPDDIRKIEFVSWQESEDNSEADSANIAPAGKGILGRIDPPRDLDFYRFQLPAKAREVSVLVEQTGPGEVRSRVRVFGAGTLLADQTASSRGRNLYFTFPVRQGMPEFLLSVEDYLGRYSSMFPYVLKVGVK